MRTQLTQKDLDLALKYGLEEALLWFWPNVPDVGRFSRTQLTQRDLDLAWKYGLLEAALWAAGERLLEAGQN